MGQAIGLPCPVEGVKAYTNLPREAVAALLTSYGINGESWSLNVEMMKEIVNNTQNITNSAGVSDESIVQLFEAFDTDRNGLIDTLEWLVAVALVSGMDVVDKVQFVFSLYDFERTGLLGRDAVCLLLRSAVKGLAKMCPSQVLVSNVTFKDLEDAADVLFYGVPRASQEHVSLAEFQAFSTQHPVLTSWLKFFSAVQPLQENVPLVFRGAKEVPAPVLAPPTGAAALPVAADPALSAISVAAADFDAFYTPTARAPTDLTVLKAPEEGEALPEPEPEPVAAAPVEEEKKDAPAEGEEGAEGGEGEEKAEGEGEEEEAAPAEDEAAEGGEGEGEGEAPKVVKPKILKPPAPFDTPDLSAAALPWFAKTELMRPEEVPPFRVDKPEDVLEPVWVHGLGAGSHDAPEMTRFAQYSAADSVVYPAARLVVSLTKKVDDELAAAMAEEGYDPDADPAKGPFVWTQQVLSEHQYPITCCQVDATGQYLLTADRVVLPPGQAAGPHTDPARVVVWELTAGVVRGSVEVPLATALGVRAVDFSPSGRLFLALLADEHSTLCVYQTHSQRLVFTAPLGGPHVTATAASAVGPVHVTDVRFAGSDGVLVITGSHGVHFLVDEGTAVLGPAALRAYERRAGLYEVAGRDAEGVVATVASRFEKKDECVVGSALGHVTLWKGRCCAQLLAAHRGPVTALSYSRNSGLLASGGKDNRIQLFQVAPGGGPRTLLQVGSIDLLTLDIMDRAVRSLCLHASGRRVLVGMNGGELRELASDVRLKPRELPPPVVEKTPEEVEAEAAAAAAAAEGEASGEMKTEGGEEGGEPPVEKSAEELEAEAAAAEAAEKEKKRRKLGDDINGGPLVASHWLGGRGAAVDGVAKVASGGFLTNGRDGSVRLWQTAEGTPQMCIKSFVLPPIAGLAPGAEVKTRMAVSAEFVVLAVPGGALQVLSLPDLVPVYEHQHTTSSAVTDAELWARDLKFAPDGLTLAMACADGSVALYTVTPGALVAAAPADGDAPPPAEEGGEGGEAAAAAPSQFLVLKDTFQVDFTPGAFDFSSDAQYMRLTDTTRSVLSVRQLFYTAPPPVEPVEPPAAAEGEDGEAPAAVEPAEPVEPPQGVPVGAECSDDQILRPMTFATNSVPCSWDLKGCWNSHAGAVGHTADAAATVEPILACERNEGLFVAARTSGHLALTRIPQPLFVPCPATRGLPPNQSHLLAHVGPVASLLFLEEGARLVTCGAQDGLVVVWKVTYDTEEADPANLASIPNIKKVGEEGEEGEGEAEAAPPAEEEEEAVEEEAEELDDEGNPIPRGPVLYDSAEEEDLFDGRRMKTHLALVPRPAEVRRQAVRGLGLVGVVKASEAGYNAASKERLSALLPWAASVGLSTTALEMLAHRPPPDGSGTHTPLDELKLHWVHGYSCRLTRGAVRYSAEGNIVYPAASLAVTLDKVQRQQLHTMAHSDEITCLDVHVKSGVAASAHKGAGDIYACVWEPATGKILQRLNCGACNGVSALAFSPDGSLLAVSLQDEQHQVLLWDWRKGFLKARVDGGRKKVLCLAFSLCPAPPPGEDAPPPPPADVAAAVARASLFPPANSLAPPLNLPVRVLQAGVGHFSFLELKGPVVGQAGAVLAADGGRVLTSRAGSYGADAKKVNVLCCAALPVPEEGGDEFVMGMANGQLGVVGRGERAASRFVDVQKGALTAVWVVFLPKNEDGQLFKLVTGGTGGFIKVLDQAFEPLAEFNLYRVPETYGFLHPLGKVRGVKSVCVDRFNRKIVYGTAGGEIGELELEGGKDVNRGPLVRSHFRDELHALCTHPLRQQCLTAGDDKTLRVWNLETAAMETSIDLPDVARCACFAPNGLMVAVGLGGAVRGLNRPSPRPCNGQVAIVSFLQGVLNIVHRTTDAKEAVTSVVFSPDGARLYCGSLDGVVYVYDALNNFKILQRMYSTKESVMSLDITQDGKHLVSMGPTSEVTVWDTTTWMAVDDREKAALLASPGSAQTQWHARQGTFGADCAGAFPLYGRADEVLSLGKSHDSSLLVTGTHAGQLQLRTYPSKALDAPCRAYCGHSAGGVAKVAFSVDDKYVMSVGRDDRVLLQWKVVRSGTPPAVAAGPPAAVGKPPARPLQSGDYLSQKKAFGQSLRVGDVDFADAYSPADRALQDPLAVSLAAGFGCGAPGAYPKAVYVGAGDVLTVQGRSVACLSGADRLTTRHWHHADTPGDDIGAMAVSPCRRYLALASRFPRPLAPAAGGIAGATTTLSVFIAATGALVSQLTADLFGEVTELAFSQCGSALAYLLSDPHHTLGVYATACGDWHDAALVHSTPTGEEDMAAAKMAFVFSPRRFFSSASDKAAPIPEPPAPEAAAADAAVATTVPDVVGTVVEEPQYFDLVTASATGAVRFWGINGRNMVCKSGDYGDGGSGARPAITSVCGLLNADLVVTGDSEGQLWAWQGSTATRCTQQQHSHAGAVTALLPFAVEPATEFTSWGGQGFFSAGTDQIAVWSWVYGTFCEQTRVFSFADMFASPHLSMLTLPASQSQPLVTGLSVDAKTKRMLVTLSTSTLLEVAIESRTNVASVLTESVSAAPTAIAAHPFEAATVVTADADCLLKVWDVSPATRGVTATVSLPRPASALAFHPSGALIAALAGTAAAGPSLLWLGFAQPYAPGTVPRTLAELSSVELVIPAPPPAKGKKAEPATIVHAPLDAQWCSQLSGSKVHSLAVSADGTLVVVGLDGGIVETCLLQNKQCVTGKLQVHAASAGPVAGVDLTADGKYLRTFGPSPSSLSREYTIEVHIFKLDGVAGKEVTDKKELGTLKTATWRTCSSPAAPEATATMPFAPANPAVLADLHPVAAWGREVTSVCVHATPGGDGSLLVPATAAALTNAEIEVRLRKELETRGVEDGPARAKSIAADLKRDDGRDCLSTMARRLDELLRDCGVTDHHRLAEAAMRDFREQATANLKTKGAAPGHSKGVVAAGYSDGSVELYRLPGVSAAGPLRKLAAHAHGAVLTAFTAHGQLCTIGETDGALMVWDVRG